jgi:hypothetical protein
MCSSSLLAARVYHQLMAWGAVVLTGVLPSCVLATLAANSYASFSLNSLTYVSAAFSNARASHWSDLRMITPFGPVILMVL